MPSDGFCLNSSLISTVVGNAPFETVTSGGENKEYPNPPKLCAGLTCVDLDDSDDPLAYKSGVITGDTWECGSYFRF